MSDARIARQLETLAGVGRRSLAPVARRAALERALAWAVPAALPAPLLLCLAGVFARVDALWALALGAAVPLSAGGVAYALLRARQVIDRRTALGIFDVRLQAGDRIGAADQFLHEGQYRDGFRAAAVLDAQPWIERALQLPAVALDPGPIQWPRRAGRWLTAALVLLGLATLMPGGRAPRSDDFAGRAAADPSPAVLAGAADPYMRIGSDAAGRNERAGSSGSGEVDPARLAAGAVASPSGAGPAPARAGNRGPAARRGVSATASGDATVAAQPGAAATKGAAASVATPAGASKQATPAQVRIEGDEGGNGESASDHRSAVYRREDAANSPSQAGLPGAGQRSGLPASQSRPNEQGPGQPPQRNPSQRGDQGQGQGQSRGQGNSQGQHRQGRGEDDDIKRTRGVSGLLLGVPMEDRLIGTPSPGRIKSLPRPARPTATAATPSQRQTRGEGSGDAGEIAHRPLSVEDERLVRDYFMRQREAAGAQDRDKR